MVNQVIVIYNHGELDISGNYLAASQLVKEKAKVKVKYLFS